MRSTCSREPIPWVRDTGSKTSARQPKHWPVVFRRDCPDSSTPPAPRTIERIEQRRALRCRNMAGRVASRRLEHAQSGRHPEDVADRELLAQTNHGPCMSGRGNAGRSPPAVGRSAEPCVPFPRRRKLQLLLPTLKRFALRTGTRRPSNRPVAVPTSSIRVR